jgi:cytochrome c biogenesis protein CcdA
MLTTLIADVANGSVIGPVLGLAIGVLLGLSPVAFPMIPAIVGTLSPGQLDAAGRRRVLPVARAFPTILAFTAGMNGVLGVAGYLFVTVTVLAARTAVISSLAAAAIMGVIGIRLLTRRTSLCSRATAVPPRPAHAFLFGVFFSIGGCPGCGPIAIGLGAAAASIAGPLYALAVIAAFVLGHALVLTVAANLGARLLPQGKAAASWLRLDLVVGVMLLAAAAFYVYRVASGDVTTLLPGEPGSGTLPG